MRYGSGSRRVPGASSKLRNGRREVVTVGHPSRRTERMSTDDARYSRSTPAAPSPIFITNQDAIATSTAAADADAEDSGYPLSEAAYGLSERATRRQASSSMLFGTQRVTRDDFIPVKTIGKGSFAKVLLVRKRDTGEIFAMKILSKRAIIARNQLEHTMAERSILENVRHPYIVALRYAFQTEGLLYLVLDFCAGGELFFHLKREGHFPESTVRIFMAEITLALEHLHAHNIIYRDLKPENVLLDRDGHVLLADFGLSKLLARDNQKAMTYVGTVEYLAPEVITNQGHSFAVDWWAMGTLMAELITGLPPFYSNNVNLMMERVLKADLRLPEWMSLEAQSLIAGLLTRDPLRRLGSGPGGAAEIKRHPFFRGLDWAALLRRQVPSPYRPLRRDALPDSVENFDSMFTSEPPTFDMAAEEEKVRAKLMKRAHKEREAVAATTTVATAAPVTSTPHAHTTEALDALDGHALAWDTTHAKAFEGFTYTPGHRR